MIADDFETIRLRMAEIEAEKKRAPAESAVNAAVEQYLAGGSTVVQHQTYFGWDIYPPVNFSAGN